MPAPYDYTLGQVPNPAQSFLQGIQTVDALRQREEQMAAAEQAKKQQEAFRTMQTEYWNTPNPTLQQTMRLASMLPKDQAEMLFKGVEAQDKAKTQANLALGGQVLSSLLANNKDTAVKLLREREAASINSGDKAGSQQWGALAQQIEIAKPEESFKIFAPFMAAYGEEGRKMLESVYGAQKQPLELKRLGAEADIAESKKAFVGIPDDAQMAQWWTNATPAQKDAYLKIQQVKKPPTPVTNIQIDNLLDKTGMGEIAKLMPAYQEKMISAASQLDKIPEYKAALSNAITGPGAEIRLTGARVANLLGFTGDKALQDTATLVQGLAQQTLDARGSLAGQGQITEGEQKLLMRAKSGDISMSPKELETLFKVSERAANAQYEQANRMLEGAKARGSQTADLLLSTVPMPANRVKDPKTGKTYTRPAQMTDAQWQAYKQSLGAQ